MRRFLYDTFVVAPGPRRCAGCFGCFTDATKAAIGEAYFNKLTSNGVRCAWVGFAVLRVVWAPLLGRQLVAATGACKSGESYFRSWQQMGAPVPQLHPNKNTPRCSTA